MQSQLIHIRLDMSILTTHWRRLL